MRSLRRFLLFAGVSVLRGASSIQQATLENEGARVRRQESEYRVQNGNGNDKKRGFCLFYYWILFPVFLLRCLLVGRFLLIGFFDGIEYRAGTLHMNLDFQNLVE
jgi:hypothetical protein